MGGMTAFVRRSSDETLARIFAARPARRLLVASIVRAIPPERVEALEGQVQVDLVRPATRRREKRVEPWVFEFDEGRVRAHPGEVEAPQLSVSVRLPDFVRVAAGELDPMTLVFERRIKLKGNFALAERVAALAGGEPR